MSSDVFEPALAGIREALAADGFSLSVEREGNEGAVSVVLAAGPEACLDCLVPDEVLVQIVEDSLRAGGHTIGTVRLEKRGI